MTAPKSAHVEAEKRLAALVMNTINLTVPKLVRLAAGTNLDKPRGDFGIELRCSRCPRSLSPTK